MDYQLKFHWHFWDVSLQPLYRGRTVEIEAASTMHMHMNTAVKTPLLKHNEDTTDPSSYCHLSLINTNLEIITKDCATRLGSYQKQMCSEIFNIINVSQ